MKKIHSFLLAGICLGIVFYSCEKDKPEVTKKNEPVVIIPTLTVQFSPTDSVPYKDSLVMTWTSNLEKLEINGKIYDNNNWILNGVVAPNAKKGKITYKKVMTDQKFKFVGNTKNATIEQEYMIKVGHNLNALRDDSLCLNICWGIDSTIYLSSTDNKWHKWFYVDVLLSRRTYFNKDGSYKSFLPDGSLHGAGSWRWIENSLEIGDQISTYKFTSVVLIRN